MIRKLLSILYFPYKWLIFFPILAVNTIIFGVIAVLVSSLINQRVGSFYGGVVWSRFNALITPVFVTVKGKENIEKGKSYIIVPNHQSMYDIFILYGWLGLDIKWMMKKELRKIPGVGFGSAKVGHIFIDRSNQRAAMQSLNEAKNRLINGSSVVIFPEGTRSKDGKLLPFKRGAFKLALDLGYPILPVTIKGTREIMPANSPVKLLPGKATLTIHEPIQIGKIGEEQIPELMEKVKLVIESGLKN
jgi:1-acyl-sn-glycerol-3-phosphate acyltransferase